MNNFIMEYVLVFSVYSTGFSYGIALSNQVLNFDMWIPSFFFLIWKNTGNHDNSFFLKEGSFFFLILPNIYYYDSPFTFKKN